MANPFVKAWAYFTALFNSTVEEHADPKVQIEQAIMEAKRHHKELSHQATAIIGNQRQLEMKLNRQLEEIEKLRNNVRHALLMAEESRKIGDTTKAREYEGAADAFASRLVSVEATVSELKSLYDQSIAASVQAKEAVQRNAHLLEVQMAQRTQLLNQLDQTLMQEKIAEVLQQFNKYDASGSVPNLEQIREKIEQRYARALGSMEFSDITVEARMAEVESHTSSLAVQSKVEAIRSQMKAAGELSRRTDKKHH